MKTPVPIAGRRFFAKHLCPPAANGELMGNNTRAPATQGVAQSLKRQQNRRARRNRTRRTAAFIYEEATSLGFIFGTNGRDILVIVFPPPSRLPQHSETFSSFQRAIHAHGPQIIDIVI
jgi:hypothetical protein